MPDRWEIEKFGNLDQTGDGDYDGDTSSNYEEYVAGTDPTDPGSFFAVTNIEKIESPFRATMTWSSVTGKYYAVYYSDDAFDSLMDWTLVQDMIPASGTGSNTWVDDGSLTDPDPDQVPYRYYKLRVYPD